MDQIRAAARAFEAKYDRLDVLLNNAGAYFPQRLESAQGLEMTFAVNHLGYFLLTHELRSLLASTESSRVVNVSSRAHASGQLDFDDLQFETRPYRAMKAYGTSKLANILFTRELARRLEGTGTTANCVHPGVIRSGFGKDEPGLMKWLVYIGGPFLQSPKAGARGNIHLSTSPDVADISGEYFIGKKVKQTSKAGADLEAARRLWEVSESLCGIA
jgi:NAD(P)-dependent dehydrogenase (short-subunit alcohol dehydrogenase family)